VSPRNFDQIKMKERILRRNFCINIFSLSLTHSKKTAHKDCNCVCFFFFNWVILRLEVLSLICSFPLFVAQMVPLHLKIWVFQKALLNKMNAGINFLPGCHDQIWRKSLTPPLSMPNGRGTLNSSTPLSHRAIGQCHFLKNKFIKRDKKVQRVY
jgi:hypothetical protein